MGWQPNLAATIWRRFLVCRLLLPRADDASSLVPARLSRRAVPGPPLLG